MGYFDTKMTGDILQRINDHTRIQNFLTGSSLSVVFSTFNIVVFGIVLLLYNWMIFLIFMGGSVLYVAYVWLFMKSGRNWITSVLHSRVPIRVQLVTTGQMVCRNQAECL